MTIQQATAPSSRWLGTMPERFVEGRLSHVATAWTSNVDKHTVAGEPAVRLCNYTDVYKNDSITDTMAFMQATASPEQIKRFKINVGDTLITKDSETADDIGIPSYVRYEADDLICGYHLAIIRPDSNVADPRFLYWVMGSDPVLGQWSVQASGVTRVGIRSSDLAKVAIPIPPRAEQRAIADFLDEQTSRIDTLIAKQTQLIDTLRERRISTIHRAVTSSSTKDAPQIPSPFRWMDSVPGNWRVGPLRHFIQFTTGWTPPTGDDGSYVGHHKWANISDLGDKTISTTAKSLSDTAVAGQTPSLPGDLLFSFKLSVGRVSLVESPMFTNEAIATFRSSSNLLAGYAYYALPVFVPRNANTNIYGAALLNSALIRSAPFACPPVGEQKEIMVYLDEQTSKIDALIAKAEKHIELARERRSALITAAVTGQIDVRTAGRAATVGA